jgi:hypothetical protein
MSPCAKEMLEDSWLAQVEECEPFESLDYIEGMPLVLLGVEGDMGEPKNGIF